MVNHCGIMRKIPERLNGCDVETPDDFQLYYRGSIVGIPNGQTLIPYVSAGIRDEGIFSFIPIAGRTDPVLNMAFRDLRNMVSFSYPSLGMVNVGPTAYYTSMTAIRAAEKGFRAPRVTVISFNTWFLRNLIKPIDSSSSELIYALYNKEYYEPREAIQLLESGDRVGCALSPLVSLFIEPKATVIQVAYTRNMAGYLRDGKIVLQNQYHGAARLISRSIDRREVVLA